MFIDLPKKAHDMTGRRFSRLVVRGPVEIVRYQGTTHLVWLCDCDCGVECRVRAGNLKSGNTVSCGCLKIETAGVQRLKHGGRKTSEYRIWCHMLGRCNNPNDSRYADYGGRGVKVKYESFGEFIADVGPRPSASHSIDRRDNNGHYELGNCRWATSDVQANNNRRNRMLTLNGRAQSMAQWARELGVKYSLLINRVSLGWSDEDVLTRPLRGISRSMAP